MLKDGITTQLNQKGKWEEQKWKKRYKMQ